MHQTPHKFLKTNLVFKAQPLDEFVSLFGHRARWSPLVAAPRARSCPGFMDLLTVFDSSQGHRSGGRFAIFRFGGFAAPRPVHGPSRDLCVRVPVSDMCLCVVRIQPIQCFPLSKTIEHFGSPGARALSDMMQHQFNLHLIQSYSI